MNDEVLLFSGGMDSLIAWYYLDKPKCLYVDLGHKYAAKEKEALVRIREKEVLNLEVVTFDTLGLFEEKDGYIPMRNSFLIHLGTLYVKRGGKVWLIVQKGEMEIPDRSDEFFHIINNLMIHLKPKVNVSSPFFDMTKVQMVEWYMNNNLPVNTLLATSSCYSRSEGKCGKCPACFRRWVALELNGLEEEYRIEPWKSEIAEEYKERARNGEYHPQRAGEIIMALEQKGVF